MFVLQKQAAYDKESFSQPIDIQVHLAGPAPEEELTIGIHIGGNAREGVDYVILDERKKMKNTCRRILW